MTDKRVANNQPPIDLGIPMHGAKYIITGKELYLGDVTFDAHDNIQLTFYRAADLPNDPERQQRKLGIY